MTTFKNRVFGAAMVKAVNSNYNADFSGQPRTLPNGIVYATDKAFKYTIKNYLKDIYTGNSKGEYVFYFKRVNEEINALSLEEAYKHYRKDFLKINEEINAKDKTKALAELLKCIDVRLFGATFAMKASGGNIAVSIHGPVQINHGMNLWHENNIYSEQILSPFRNPKEEKKSSDEELKQTGQTTIGRQSKLEEGHYLHHFSINPKNLEEVVSLAGDNAPDLTDEDINKLKEAMRRGATYYDSSSKAGTENELLIWVQLNENSKIVLPNLSSLIKMETGKKDGKVVLDLSGLSDVLKQFENEIEKTEIYRNEGAISIENKPERANIFGL
ncbi:MAG: type I CRISPR-associated protein Cas7 [Bacteroidota bacterium]